jgi:glutamate-ammonia-ligase adenylyltransferase
MRIEELRACLEDPRRAVGWLQGWGLADIERGHANLVRMAMSGITLDLLGVICTRLDEILPHCSDPDMALNNLERFVGAARSPLALASLFERDPEALAILVQIFSTSQHLSDLLIIDPEAYDLLRLTEGQPVNREVLVEELAAETAALADEAAVMAALRRYKRRETLRICYGDIIGNQRLEVVAAQISYLADAILESAVRFARRKLVERRGEPRRPDGQPARFVVVALGKLGGVELNYSSDIDLVFLYECDGATDGPRPQTNAEFFDRLAREVVRLLTEPTELGQPYRVDLRLRPEGERGPLVHSLEQALHYYDVLGRTWERQAYVKARPAAGDLSLGREFLQQLEPWIYRRYLGLADITGIKALKRRIEQRAQREGGDIRNVKTGRGGLRDVEFVIQFLQLLNGGDLPEVRTGNTLEAIARLEQVGCLTHQERTLLEENYSFLRRVEHRLQIMFDLQTHLLPAQEEEMRKLALRLGYRDNARRTALAAFTGDLDTKTRLNRTMLDHLLHDAFGDDAQTEPEVDLVLDPQPPEERVQEVLSRHRFRDVQQAYRNLLALSTERVRFLSTRRCRHFLASIAPRLLRAIAATPDPDSTLVNLEKVSDSLGGKGVLWELFSFNPPSMNLYVEICASSPFLSGLLVSNPGMIDELMDSLVLNKLPTLEDLRGTLHELLHAAEDVDPILHAFKNGQLLRVGVRDVLGKEDIQATTGALSDVAQVCLEEIAAVEYQRLVSRLGTPMVEEGPHAGQPSGWVVLALGKFGGREMNYHSDLDVVFLYEADGHTQHPPRVRRAETTTNQHFFSELAQRIIRVATRLGPHGRLYEIDSRLRPTGKSGALATPFAEFARYFSERQGQLWERQALCKARVVAGEPRVFAQAEQVVAAAAFDHPWQGNEPALLRDMRRRIEEHASAGDIKRGPGGLVDIEFLVQLYQLRHGKNDPAIRQPGTLAALDALHARGYLNSADYELLSGNYRFLRTLEGRLRLMSTTSRDALSDDPLEAARLARGMGFADAQHLLAECQRCLARTRERFEVLCSD